MHLKIVFVFAAVAAALVGCGDKKTVTERPPIVVETLTATPTTAFRWVDTLSDKPKVQRRWKFVLRSPVSLES